jgi:MFS family permease
VTAAPAGRAHGGPLATLRSPGYGILWTASLLWNQARWMDQVVLGWTVLEITNSAWHVAIIGVLRSLPMMLLGVFGGAIADRFERRRLLIGAQVLGAVVSLAIGGLLWLEALRYEHAVAAALLLGVQWAVDWPARRALIPDMVGRDLTQSAIVLESVSMNLTRITGPLAAGALIAYASPASSYFVMGLLYLVEIVLLIVMPLRARKLGPRTMSMARYLREGFDELRFNHPIVGVLLITVFMNAFAFPYQQILSVFARDVLNTDPIGLGVLGAASGVGALAGALFLSARPFVPRPALLFSIGSFTMSAALIGFALSRSFELSVVLLLISGLGSASFSAFQSTIILRAAPEQIRGRAMGVLTLAIGTAPIGLLEIGAITAAFGAPIAVATNAALCAGLVVWVAVRLPGFRKLSSG